MQEIEKQKALIEDLERQLKESTQASRGEDNLKPNVSLRSLTSTANQTNLEKLGDRDYIRNLERESRLMSSAFHELAGRLQLNNVVPQRKAEAPKNWLARQRRHLEAPGGLVR